MKKITVFKIFIFFIDFVIFYLSLYIALFLRKWGRGEFLLWKSFLPFYFYIFLFWAFLLFIFDFYHFNEKNGKKNIKKFFFHFFVLALLSGMAFFYLKPEFQIAPKTILFLDLLIFSGLVFILRVFLMTKKEKEVRTDEEKYQKIKPQEITKEEAEYFQREPSLFYIFSKKIFDLFFGILGFFIFAFTFPFIAFFIKTTSGGPIFFVQKRVGKNGRIFNSFKYRSMYFSKEKEERELWREKDKNEITPVGQTLRQTHFDELPQNLNILKGELSFVGPRAEWRKLVKIYEKEIPNYKLRYLAKPGLTGWAQINFPPSLSVKEAKEKLEYDLYYIKHRSFWFDLSIFLRSLKKIFG